MIEGLDGVDAPMAGKIIGENLACLGMVAQVAGIEPQLDDGDG